MFHASRTQREFENALNKNGMEVRQQLIWNKNQFTMGRQDYQWKHEPIFYGWKEGAHYFTSKRNLATVLDEDKPVRNDIHPTAKPINLLSRMIMNSTKKGEKVLDLFGGSGATLIACEQTERQCFMMEFDPKYADVIIARYEQFTGKEAELDG